MWDDTGGASEQDVQMAQAQQIAMNQMWAAANPTMMQMGNALQPSGRKQRELYVGNLTVGVVGGEMLKEFFTSILTQCEGYSPTMGPPVAVVQLSGEGKFAFVEFRDELIAVTALQLDKVELANRPLNIGRPAGYQPAPGMALPAPLPLPKGVSMGLPSAPPDPAAAAAVAALVGGSINGAPGSLGSSATATPMPGGGINLSHQSALSGLGVQATQQAGRKQRELYVGNLPLGMVTAMQLKELFRAPLLTMPNIAPEESAGPLCLNVDLSADGKFAFVEFRDEDICTLALTLFDKMEVCGRALNVGRPRGYIDPNMGASALLPGGCAPAMPPMGMPGMGMPGMGLPPPPSGMGGLVPPPPPGGLAPPPPPPSHVIKLEGMLTAEILQNDEEYNEVLDDIKTECEDAGGKVESVVMPREGPHATMCFVTFAEVDAAAKARQSLDKRQFDGNTVRATFIAASDVPAA